MPVTQRPLVKVFVLVMMVMVACQPAQNPTDTLTTYYEAFKARDLDKMVSMTSDYSLKLLNAVPEDLKAVLVKSDMAGVRLLDYKILESKTLSTNTVMVRAVIKYEEVDQKSQTVDFWTGLRQENGQWRINASDAESNLSLVDDLLLTVQPQTINSVTVQPTRLIRFSAKLRLIFSVRNVANRNALFAWGGVKNATFHFGTVPHDATNATKAASIQSPQLPGGGLPWSYSFVLNK